MKTIEDIMFACCILHSMIIDDERGVSRLEYMLAQYLCDNMLLRHGLTFEDFMASTIEIENEFTHYKLHNDLIEHLWQLKDATLGPK